MLKFSIVTPSYNQAQFIGETIDSVLDQAYPQVEYIVMDGGSNDGTVDILRRYDDRIQWVSEADDGQSDAIEKGFARASGDIYAWLNSDDTYLSNTFTSVADFFEAHPDVDLVYGDLNHIASDGHLLSSRQAPDFDAEMLKQWCYVPQPATFFRRQLWEAVGGLDRRLHHAMDWDLWLRMAQKGKVCRLPVTLANFRWHNRSKSIALAYGQNYEAIFVVRSRYGHFSRLENARDFLTSTTRATLRALWYRLRNYT
ncbi:MAG: glycosyltransferase [Anaerolineae bacterium]|nr:glycosyltransferase [Anaerolineae bacterium]